MTKIRSRGPVLLLFGLTFAFSSPAQSLPPQTHPDTLVSQATAVQGSAPVLHPAPPAADISRPLQGRTILVDPGHGGKDPGAMRSGVEEKNITLDVALDLRVKLQSLGARVVLTRDTDTFIPLPDRLGDSNSLCPDVFLSIHANSVGDRHIDGIETYYFDGRGQRLAVDVLDTLSERLHQAARWSHARDLKVLDGNRAPATLAEIGYITNPETRARLATPSYQNQVASGLAASLVNYFDTPGSPHGCQV